MGEWQKVSYERNLPTKNGENKRKTSSFTGKRENNGGKQKDWSKPAGASAVTSDSDDQRFVRLSAQS